MQVTRVTDQRPPAHLCGGGRAPPSKTFFIFHLRNLLERPEPNRLDKGDFDLGIYAEEEPQTGVCCANEWNRDNSGDQGAL